MVVGLAFLVGYFSDSAVAKLTEIANTLFGTSNFKQVRDEANSRSGRTEETQGMSPGPAESEAR
jgi:hypothetical protein